MDPKQTKLNPKSEIWAHMGPYGHIWARPGPLKSRKGPARALEEREDQARTLEELEKFRKNALFVFKLILCEKIVFGLQTTFFDGFNVLLNFLAEK